MSEELNEEEVARNVPWDLQLVSVGPVETIHTTHDETGRSVTLKGMGPKAHGKRVNIFSVERGGPLAGDAVKPDGSWEMSTVPLPLGTTEHLFACSIGSDGKNLSHPSKHVTAVIPPA